MIGNNCWKCGAFVRDWDEKCPHCGANDPRMSKEDAQYEQRNKVFGYWFAVITLVLCIVGYLLIAYGGSRI